MIGFDFKPSFDKSLKSLPATHKENIKSVCYEIIDVLNKEKSLRPGLGFKPLPDNHFEVRDNRAMRVLFQWAGDNVIFILAGNHKQIKNYLKNNT